MSGCFNLSGDVQNRRKKDENAAYPLVSNEQVAALLGAFWGFR
ncbi:hypothetical protein LMG28688_01420 [Paraburkholderia caffeinitolerans]|uniref:Uncharacterized protein n=1 Tax=Paraburkholderia caffeinitolerans TaxID=1723730 RepID=A0A6J5FNN9_9BURK|nr:hypothetical protein LMG28688_01420 [Paraburkholderia caffeinitolerans]CAB3802630.1 hypothetical protein LMG28690_05625 [Paraburkholderia caffeinilytica]